MNKLTIGAAAHQGPLEVSVHGPGGASFEFVLSSELTEQVIPAFPGRYAVIARRPNGTVLRRSVEVRDKDQRVDFTPERIESPNEFMESETLRGQVAITEEPSGNNIWRATLPGVLGEALSRATRGLDIQPQPQDYDVQRTALRHRIRGRQMLSLRLWRLRDESWQPVADPERHIPGAAVSSDFVKLTIQPRRDMLALGLLDENGVGPIVNVPPLRAGLEITFLARSLIVRAADRTRTPGGQRMPVAVVLPHEPAVADLLAALAAPATPSAAELWEQAAPAVTGNSHDEALPMLQGKFEWPAEALVAAHYLLRFMPERLPLTWADNLRYAMPKAADGPVIAAWAHMLNPPKEMAAEELDRKVEEYVQFALVSPVTLFARTRALLADALKLVSKKVGEKYREREAAFRRCGAEAGGLEAFWGRGPADPIETTSLYVPTTHPAATTVSQVSLINGAFNGMPPGPGGVLRIMTPAEAADRALDLSEEGA